MSFYSHCVKHDKEYLLKEWDAKRNAPLTPESLASTSTTRVWWKCEKGHSWQTQLASRARGNTGCPLCLRERIAARMEKSRAAEAERKKSGGKGEITVSGGVFKPVETAPRAEVATIIQRFVSSVMK